MFREYVMNQNLQIEHELVDMGFYLCLSMTVQLVCVELVPPPWRTTYRYRCLPHKPKSGSRIVLIPSLQNSTEI
jgi:hypothetical protein